MFGLKARKNALLISLISLILVIASPVYASTSFPQVLLPSSEITMEVINPWNDCYYEVVLSDVPTGYHVSNGIYSGWCVDEQHCISVGVKYRARMYSSYDPNNPHSDPDWDKVNYILNHKNGNGTWRDVQEAIWFFIDGGNDPSTEIGRSMVDEANRYGEGFIPGPGEALAVVLYIDNCTQIPIIEVIVPLQNVVPQYPFGPILGTLVFIAALCIFKYKHKMPKFLELIR